MVEWRNKVLDGYERASSLNKSVSPGAANVSCSSVCSVVGSPFWELSLDNTFKNLAVHS